MNARMHGKTVIVTGAGAIADGMSNGRAAALLYAREGARVLAVDRNLASAEQTCAMIREEGGECQAHATDVAQSTEVQRMVAAAMDHFGRIDVLHNNVGIAETGGPVEASEDSWNRLVAVNQTSLFLTCKFTLPIMLQQGNGAIVTIASVAAQRWLGFPYAAYTATKAAVIALTQNIAAQYAAQGIRANCISPGLMDTPMVRASLTASYGGNVDSMLDTRHGQCPMGFMGSDQARYITGINLLVDGGLSLRCA
jgi:NAD(P)-dependent dehydrogenase (short-subunit alcohol dehydrogenase family)